jgi:hypothetical protein
VVGIKTDVDKAVVGIKTDVDKAVVGIKTDVGTMKTDLEKSLKVEIKAMEKVVTEKVNAVNKSLELLQRLVFLAMGVFIFGEQFRNSINNVSSAVTEKMADKS